MTTTINHKLVSLSDAAEALAVSTRSVRRYIADGQLDAVRLGRKTLPIKIDSIERLIDAKPVGNWRRPADCRTDCPDRASGAEAFLTPKRHPYHRSVRSGAGCGPETSDRKQH